MMRFPTFNFQTGTFDIGRFGRAPIELHAGFFLIALALTSRFWMRGTLSGLALAAIGIVVVFGSVLIHELAHAMFARRCRIPVSRIDIHFFGGSVHFGWRPARLSQDLALTFAGPASNFMLAALCYGLLLLLPDPAPRMVPYGASMVQMGFEPPSVFERPLTFALYLNLGLGIFNMLPAFPLDGGWITYRLLTDHFGRRMAGMVVGSLGIVLAAVSALVVVASILSGVGIYTPPNFQANLDALRTARRGDPIHL
jgi:Zn-dependent protease